VVFTQGGTVSPRSTAFFARRPAAIITEGFDVFVHEVMAAITTEPFSTPPTFGERCATYAVLSVAVATCV